MYKSIITITLNKNYKLTPVLILYIIKYNNVTDS